MASHFDVIGKVGHGSHARPPKKRSRRDDAIVCEVGRAQHALCTNCLPHRGLHILDHSPVAVGCVGARLNAIAKTAVPLRQSRSMCCNIVERTASDQNDHVAQLVSGEH